METKALIDIKKFEIHNGFCFKHINDKLVIIARVNGQNKLFMFDNDYKVCDANSYRNNEIVLWKEPNICIFNTNDGTMIKYELIKGQDYCDFIKIKDGEYGIFDYFENKVYPVNIEGFNETDAKNIKGTRDNFNFYFEKSGKRFLVNKFGVYPYRGYFDGMIYEETTYDEKK